MLNGSAMQHVTETTKMPTPDDGVNSALPMVTFSAGPTQLPMEVKQNIYDEFFDYRGTGIGILETMHRSKEFIELLDTCEKRLRNLLQIPSSYAVLFLQGGATGQFAAIPMNLFGEGCKKADYLVTGTWSAKALTEAQKYGTIREVAPRIEGFNDLPDRSKLEFDEDAAYFYYCDNETISGLEFQDIPQPPEGVPIVCDMSSSFLSKPIEVTRYGIIFAGTQKNLGCTGATIVIVRKDLLDRAQPDTPLILNYSKQLEARSMVNTPPTIGIYLAEKMCKWIEEQGGLKLADENSRLKSSIIYNIIENSQGLYKPHTAEAYRSRVNVVFRMPTLELENEWLKGARERGLINLKGHRSVGGLRVSLYNAIGLPETRRLAEFMCDFHEKHMSI